LLVQGGQAGALGGSTLAQGLEKQGLAAQVAHRALEAFVGSQGVDEHVGDSNAAGVTGCIPIKPAAQM
jgi:hypothetical protein